MKTSHLAAPWIGAVVFIATAALPLAARATPADAGGTIYFSGAVVSPPFGISSRISEKSQGFRTEESKHKTLVEDSTVDVTFMPAPNSVPAAHVDLLVNSNGQVSAPHGLCTRYVDRDGQHGSGMANAQYRVGGQGGVLSIAMASKGAERAVTVMVSYD